MASDLNEQVVSRQVRDRGQGLYRGLLIAIDGAWLEVRESWSLPLWMALDSGEAREVRTANDVEGLSIFRRIRRLLRELDQKWCQCVEELDSPRRLDQRLVRGYC